ncbi:hypothetical protein M407DRAFT_23464 [Tulasnella calospora MUT 4182]|uniref:Uncharacterized protein n=1 Tax=Tulasnella calospora MUT 4182 TaxID=1051891 RepID=A0A0C3QJJ2_9AGAM|nr:hypothetical protein M407DRAFT_23464 [Tulasnella calospora MUT 4182]
MTYPLSAHDPHLLLDSQLRTAHPREDLLYETPQSSTRTDEPIEGSRSQTPVEDTQAPRRDHVPTALPAGTANSVRIAKPEAPPATQGRRSTGESLETIGEDISFPRAKPLVLPAGCLVGGIILALGHHLFNLWADGRTVGKSPDIPQQWVLRAGTAFGFTFQTILAASLGFVIRRRLWYYARRKYMTLQASFLNVSAIGAESYIWGDVVVGIQETAANITASMLLLNLGAGVVDSIRRRLAHRYCLPFVRVLILLRFNPENLTTSLSDTISITHSPAFATFGQKSRGKADQEDTPRFRLGKQADGRLELTTPKDFT